MGTGRFYRQTKRTRRLIGAAVAGIALPLILASLSAGAAVPPPVPSAPAAASVTAVPSPCGSPLPLPPPITPSPAASLCPTLGGNGATPPAVLPSSVPAGGAPPTSPGNSGAQPSGNTSAPATPPGGVGAGAAANPIAPSGSIDSVLGLLSAPPNVGVERPALQHFQPTAAITARLAALAAGAPGSDNPAGGPRLPVLVVLSALMGSAVVAMVLVVFVRRVVPARFRRAAEVAAGPFGAVALISVLLLVPKSAAITTAQPATPPRVAALVVSTHRVSPAVQAAPTAGTVLLGRITSIEQTVTNLESRLQVYNTRAAQTAQGDSAMAPPEVLGSGAIAQTTQTDTATQLAGALQAEYAFYATTVKNDAADHALLSATAAVADPVRTVIAYNLEAVQTQLAQEAAIAQADAAAPTLAGLAPTALLAPLSGPITQPFGPSSLAFEPPLTVGGVTYPHFHTGIDIAAPRDTPVHAAAGGLVVIAGSSLDSQGHLAGYGNYIVLAHAGKMMTLYAHLDQLLASVGEVVHAGDVIGLEGSSGNSTGPHLHFEVRIGGLVTDPLPYLTQKF